MARSQPTLDPVTGVAARAALDAHLPSLIDAALHEQRAVALMVIDLDHFKSINDAFGHARGDMVLAEFARRVRLVVRGGDEVYRYGGDEFVVVLPGTTIAQARQVAQRLLDDLRSRPFAGNPPITLTVSIGIARCPEDGASAEELFTAADRRSLHAKRSGRSRVLSADLTAPASVEPPSRLIDRDDALSHVNAFLDALPGQTRSLLQIDGPNGAGRSRIIEEISRRAAMRGIAVLGLRGSPALRTRLYGAFTQADLWPELATPSIEPGSFVAALGDALEQRGADILLLTLDDAAELDRASLELVRALVADPRLPRLAIVTVDPGWPAARYGLDERATLDERVELAPLTEEGVRAWLRHALHWEPAPVLLEWFSDVTGRLPARIARALERLVASGALQPTEHGWIYRPDAIDLTAEALALPHSEHARSLPVFADDLVGRVEELRHIAGALALRRVVILRGPGGVGKSRLALQAARESAGRFPGGVWWVPLADLTAERQILPAIATAIGLEAAGANDLFDRLAVIFQHHRALLVLDNLDELGANYGPVAELLDRAPLLHALVTSREATRLPDAIEILVGGLSLPVDAEISNADATDAVQLFVHCARRLDPGFVLGETERMAVAQICQLVEGMPLGIELAAAQINNASIDEIAADLAASRLARERPGSSERWHSLTMVIEGFWRLLSRAERMVLSRLGVFRGGFNTDSAGAVAEASPFFLNALVAAGYLRRSAAGRYELHELLRQYALQQLDRDPADRDRTLDRHSVYYLEYAAHREEQLLASRTSHDQIRLDLPNLRSAWERAVATANAGHLARASLALYRYSIAGGQVAEQLAELDAAIAALGTRQGVSARDLALLHAHRANACYSLSRYAEAITGAQHARVLARAAGDPEAEALALLGWGSALIIQTEFTAAHARLGEAIALARAAGLGWLEGSALLSQGYADNALRRYGEARTAMRHALVIFQAIGDRRGEATALSALGNLAEDRGDPTARQFYEQALRLYRTLGDRDGECGVLHNLAVVDLLLGHHTQAYDALEEALAGFAELGSRFGEAVSLYNLGRAARNLGHWDAAERAFAQSLELVRLLGNREFETNVLHGLAETFAAQQRVREARARWAEAIRLARALRDRRSISRILAGVARVEIQRRKHFAALRAARRAYRLAVQIDHPLFRSDALIACGRALIALGEFESAAYVLRRADNLLSDLGLDGLAAVPRALLAYLALRNGEIGRAVELAAGVQPYLGRELAPGTPDYLAVAESFRQIAAAASHHTDQRIVLR